MTSAPLPRLLISAAGFRGADQIIIASVPLIAAGMFGAGPDLVGKLVALQSAAWLVASLPAGVFVDRSAARSVLITGHLVLCIALAVTAGSLPLFAVAAFVATAAVVTGLLAEGAAVHAAIAREALGTANGRLQVTQSLATIVAPLLVGALVSLHAPTTALLIAAAGALAGLVAVRGLPGRKGVTTAKRDVVAELREGMLFVAREPHLRAIVACALFWNTAFFVLVAIMVPWAIGTLRLSAAEIGFAQAGMGVGALGASVLAARALATLPPRAILFFGPASSAAGIAFLLLAAPAFGTPALFVTYLLLGFGPILWFVAQVTIRQLVTPKGLIGRVGAVVQTAIYGVRAIGAVVGGLVASSAGYDAALLLALALFITSTCVIPLSVLGRLRHLPAVG